MSQYSIEEEKEVVDRLKQTQEELDNELDKDSIDDEKVMMLRYRQMLQSLYLQNLKF